MSKLNKEELLKDLAFVLATWKRHYPHKLRPMRILQIFENFQQIKEVIQIQPLPDTSWEKSQITMEEAKTMIASLSNEIVKAEKKKPEVTEEWIEEKGKEFIEILGYKIFPEPPGYRISVIKNFIRSLVEEIK